MSTINSTTKTSSSGLNSNDSNDSNDILITEQQKNENPKIRNNISNEINGIINLRMDWAIKYPIYNFLINTFSSNKEVERLLENNKELFIKGNLQNIELFVNNLNFTLEELFHPNVIKILVVAKTKNLEYIIHHFNPSKEFFLHNKSEEEKTFSDFIDESSENIFWMYEDVDVENEEDFENQEIENEYPSWLRGENDILNTTGDIFIQNLSLSKSSNLKKIIEKLNLNLDDLTNIDLKFLGRRNVDIEKILKAIDLLKLTKEDIIKINTLSFITNKDLNIDNLEYLVTKFKITKEDILNFGVISFVGIGFGWEDQEISFRARKNLEFFDKNFTITREHILHSKFQNWVAFSNPENISFFIKKLDLSLDEMLDGFSKCSDFHAKNISILGITDKDQLQKILEDTNFAAFFKEEIPAHTLNFTESLTGEKIQKFLKNKIISSKKNTRIFLKEVNLDEENNKMLKFIFENSPNKFIEILQKIQFNEEFKLEMNQTNFQEIEGFFEKMKNKDKIEEKRLKIQDIKNKFSFSEKEDKQFDRAIEIWQFDSAIKIIFEKIVENFEKNYQEKWQEKIKSEFQLNKNIDITKLENENFIEMYKMSINPRYNQKQAKWLIEEYLTGKFDNIENIAQYNTEKNKKWLSENLSSEAQKIWLGTNQKIINLKNESENNNTTTDHEVLDKNILDNIKHFQEVSEGIIREINIQGDFNFETNFKHFGVLIAYFQKNIQSQKEEIITKIDENIFNNLSFQIESIIQNKTELEKTKSQKVQNKTPKKSNKILIEKSLDPLEIVQMGNCVEGSCLSFYSNVGNYYSAFANAVDVNKGVFYIYGDEKKETLLARVLVTIGDDKKITRFPMYYAKNVDINLNEIFDEYIKNLAKEMKMELNGDTDMVAIIESEMWYRDPIHEIK